MTQYSVIELSYNTTNFSLLQRIKYIFLGSLRRLARNILCDVALGHGDRGKGHKGKSPQKGGDNNQKEDEGEFLHDLTFRLYDKIFTDHRSLRYGFQQVFEKGVCQ